MRALIIDGEALVAIAKVIEHAEANVVTRRRLLAAVEGLGSPVGDEEGHVCYLRDGYRVAFSIEDQIVGMARHISVSVPEGKDYPNPRAISVIMNQFGFKETDLTKKLSGLITVWLEEEVRAVNVIEIIGKED